MGYDQIKDKSESMELAYYNTDIGRNVINEDDIE